MRTSRPQVCAQPKGLSNAAVSCGMEVSLQREAAKLSPYGSLFRRSAYTHHDATQATQAGVRITEDVKKLFLETSLSMRRPTSPSPSNLRGEFGVFSLDLDPASDGRAQAAGNIAQRIPASHQRKWRRDERVRPPVLVNGGPFPFPVTWSVWRETRIAIR